MLIDPSRVSDDDDVTQIVNIVNMEISEFIVLVCMYACEYAMERREGGRREEGKEGKVKWEGGRRGASGREMT